MQISVGNYDPAGSFSISLNGQSINMVALESFQNYTLYGGDISSFAGQLSTLTITSSPLSDGGLNMLMVDDITFSAVPEPETYILCLFGFGGFCAYRRFFKTMA